MKISPPKVFISYKWQDDERNSWVEQLYADLRIRFGIDAQLDKYEVDFGQSFSNYMTSKIDRECSALLFIITPDSVKAVDYDQIGSVNFEMQLANARRLRDSSFRIIGIYREGDKPTAYLRDHRYIDFRNDANYEDRLNELAQSLLGNKYKPKLKVVKTSSNKGKSIRRLRKEEVYNRLINDGIEWSKEFNRKDIISALNKTVPNNVRYWWKHFWSIFLKEPKKYRQPLLFSMFTSFPNYKRLVDICEMVLNFRYHYNEKDKNEIESQAIEYMLRLSDFGSELRPIRWLDRNNVKFDHFSAIHEGKAMNSIFYIGKKHDIEEIVSAAVMSIQELQDLTKCKYLEYDNEAAWTMISDLTDKTDPFEPLINIYNMGIERVGYGSPTPDGRHDSYFYIGLKSYFDNF